MINEITFAMVKSHIATSHVKTEIVLTEIIRRGFTIRKLARCTLSDQQIDLLYYEHLERQYYPQLRASVCGEVIPMVLQGEDCIRRWRQVLGATNPVFARSDTLRGMHGDQTLMANNVAHGADSEQAARREIGIVFPDAGWYELRA